MAGKIQIADVVADAILEIIKATVGVQPQIVFYGLLGVGDEIPATCESPEAGYIIGESWYPGASWMGSHVNPWETRNTSGVWQVVTTAIGEIKYVRIVDPTTRVCFLQSEVELDVPGAQAACRMNNVQVTEVGQVITLSDIRWVTPQHPSAG